MSELFETIEMKADQAELEAQEEAARKQAREDARREERQRVAKAKRHKATANLLIRIVVTVLLITGLWATGKLGLMAESMILWLYAAVVAWLAYWLGAFVQFMWCKGGLLEC